MVTAIEAKINELAAALVAAGKFPDIASARADVRHRLGAVIEPETLAKRFEPGYPLG
jgi:hypothetical protein